MNKQRRLYARGKGEFLYDYENDILTFKIKDRDYKMSVEFQNFAIDIDTENFVTGIRIFDVSKVLGFNKLLFRDIVHGKFNASIQDNVLSVQLHFVGRMRNKLMPLFSKQENFTHQISTNVTGYHLENATVSAEA